VSNMLGSFFNAEEAGNRVRLRSCHRCSTTNISAPARAPLRPSGGRGRDPRRRRGRVRV
jgi:hypothetical protein